MTQSSTSAQGRANPLRGGGNFIDRSTERRQRIVDGIENGRRRPDRPAFAKTLRLCDRRLRERFQMVDFDQRHFANRGQEIIRQGGGQDIAGAVVNDFFEQGEVGQERAQRDGRRRIHTR